MEVVNLMFAIIGHVLASVLYVIRKFSSSSKPKAIVDRSSILEHKEEIKQLWEKKMANEQPASLGESAAKEEEEEVKTAEPKKEANGDAPKIANGEAHVTAEGATPQDVEASAKPEEEQQQQSRSDSPELNKTDENKLSKLSTSDKDAAVQKEEATAETTGENKTADGEKCQEAVAVSSETEVVEVVEEKVYTSTLHQTLTVTNETSTVTVEEHNMTVTETLETRTDTQEEEFEELERRFEEEESQVKETSKQEEIVEQHTVEVIESVQEMVTKEVEETREIEDASLKNKEAEEEEENSYVSEQVDSADSLEENEPRGRGNDLNEARVLENNLTTDNSREILLNGVSADDYRPLEEFLPPRENDNIEEDIATNETAFVQNGETEEKTFEDHFVLDTRELVSPVSDNETKDAGSKKSRIHTLGVQKTEQPYSTCTTETKIAMEIREMREREEELKKMRERQAQISPAPQPQKAAAPVVKTPPIQKPVSPVGYISPTPNSAKVNTPGYRVSSVFGPRAVPQQAKKDPAKSNFTKESAVEREIRLAKDREEELRRQKGLPPREDDSYVKPSQVKSSQAKVFGKLTNAETSRLLATAKIQHEIEEQTMRELALRESGHIQTLSTERTDSKVTKLKTLEAQPECVSPTFQNGNSTNHTNGGFSNGHISPDYGYKRSTPSPTGSNYSASSYSPASRNVLASNNKGISMQKFIASRGKETTFASPRNGPFSPRSDYVDTSRAIPEPGKLKRTVSVESKIQQEILEMKLREEELKMLHSGKAEKSRENGGDYDGVPRSPRDFPNGQTGETENPCPRRNNLIAQWEQMIQNAEGRA